MGVNHKKPLVSPYIAVKRSAIHSTGVYALKHIPSGTRVIEYVGERITKKESDRRGEALVKKNKNSRKNGSVYLFELNHRHDIDGNVPYNTARFINHSCDPNCETQVVKGRIWIVAMRDIQSGEEITYDYGYDLDEYEDHRCFCGSPDCPGYIVASHHRSKLKRILKEKMASQ